MVLRVFSDELTFDLNLHSEMNLTLGRSRGEGRTFQIEGTKGKNHQIRLREGG